MNKLLILYVSIFCLFIGSATHDVVATDKQPTIINHVDTGCQLLLVERHGDKEVVVARANIPACAMDFADIFQMMSGIDPKPKNCRIVKICK